MPKQLYTCLSCGKEFLRYPSQMPKHLMAFCSRECSNPARGRSGAANGNWKGGTFLRGDGYVAVAVGDSKYRLEHDLVMEVHIGRRMFPNENVHHLNGSRSDNRLENLELLTVSEHTKNHHARQRDLSRWTECKCLVCAKTFLRRTVEIHRHPKTYCNRACYLQDPQNKGEK